MKKINIPFLYALLILCVTACSKDDKPFTDPIEEDTSTTDVYLSGTDDGKAVYWKNDEKITLSNITSSANAIFVTDNDDVYIAGKEADKAVYWKNGVRTILDANSGAVVNDIWVSSNGIVHAVGRRNDLTLPSNQFEAIYWKNDNEILLDFGEHANSLFIKDEVVYIFGQRKNGETVYWKDGVTTILPEDNVIVISHNAIYATDNGVYAAGNIITGGTSAQVGLGAYWFNENLIELQHSVSVESTFVTDITVVTNKPYISGYETGTNYQRAIYWAGNTKVNLPNTQSSIATAIFAMGNDIYIAGVDVNAQGVTYPCYWKNEVQTLLPNAIQPYGFGGVSDIIVKTSN